MEPGQSSCHDQSVSSAMNILPQVPDELKPFIGKEFTSEQAAWEFYNNYAKLAGFSVRRGQIRALQSTGQVVWRRFVCSREGKKPVRKEANEVGAMCSVQKRRCISTRVGCMAHMDVRCKGMIWFVSRFVEGHKHAMAIESETMFLRSHRGIGGEKMQLLADCKNAGIGPSKAYRLLQETAKGDDVTFTRKDVKNAMGRRRYSIARCDAELMVQYIQDRQDQDANFFMVMKKNEHGQLSSIFWADGQSRIDYMAFNDVICIDTTYKTNRYNMPFAPFVGLNHHKQTIAFGCGLISDETLSSFQWLLQSFKDAMGGIAPQAIISDQDQALGQAIAEVFPTSTHKFCLWHILRKVPEKLGHCYREHSTFERDLREVIYYDVSVMDFELNWSRFVARYGLEKIAWLVRLFEQRRNWAPVYHKSNRFLGMCTNQRSESFHSFIDHYTGRQTSLLDFVHQFERAVSRRRVDELEADRRTTEAVIDMKTRYPLEMQIYQLYTLSNYYDMRDEIWESTLYTVLSIARDGDRNVFEIINPEDHDERRILEYDVVKNTGKCSCQLFEATGIVCRHLFAVFKFLNIYAFPPFFVLRRMLRDPRSGVDVALLTLKEKTAISVDEVSSVLRSIQSLVVSNKRVVHQAYVGGKRLLANLQEAVRLYDNGVEPELRGNQHSDIGNLLPTEKDDVVHNPGIIVNKGCPKGWRKGHTSQRRIGTRRRTKPKA